MIFFLSVPFATPSDAAALSRNDDFRDEDDDEDERGGGVARRPVVNADAGSEANAARRRTNFIVWCVEIKYIKSNA